MSKTTQELIDSLRGNDLPYGDEIVEVLQSLENRLSELENDVWEID